MWSLSDSLSTVVLYHSSLVCKTFPIACAVPKAIILFLPFRNEWTSTICNWVRPLLLLLHGIFLWSICRYESPRHIHGLHAISRCNTQSAQWYDCVTTQYPTRSYTTTPAPSLVLLIEPVCPKATQSGPDKDHWPDQLSEHGMKYLSEYSLR